MTATATVTPVTRVGAGYLQATAQTPAVIALRARAWALLGLGFGARVLDIGCGPGTALPGLAAMVGPFGHVTALDQDAAMLAEAAAAVAAIGLAPPFLSCVQGSATALPLPDASQDACYCERVMQHLTPEEGAEALAEARRVLAPGGAAAFVDSDWASFSVAGGADAQERRLHAHHLARFRNPFAARNLAASMRAAGFAGVIAEPFVLPLFAEAVAALLDGATADALASGALTEAEAAAWRAALAGLQGEATPAGHLTMVIAVGRRP